MSVWLLLIIWLALCAAFVLGAWWSADRAREREFDERVEDLRAKGLVVMRGDRPVITPLGREVINAALVEHDRG